MPIEAELLCGVNRVLSPATAECVRKTCSKPALTDHIESISPDVVKAGEKFTVTCKSGYEMEYEMACQRDGTVSESECVLLELVARDGEELPLIYQFR